MRHTLICFALLLATISASPVSRVKDEAETKAKELIDNLGKSQKWLGINLSIFDFNVTNAFISIFSELEKNIDRVKTRKEEVKETAKQISQRGQEAIFGKEKVDIQGDILEKISYALAGIMCAASTYAYLV